MPSETESEIESETEKDSYEKDFETESGHGETDSLIGNAEP